MSGLLGSSSPNIFTVQSLIISVTKIKTDIYFVCFHCTKCCNSIGWVFWSELSQSDNGLSARGYWHNSSDWLKPDADHTDGTSRAAYSLSTVKCAQLVNAIVEIMEL